MIKLRELDVKDALFMLEWMHDPKIQQSFKRNMLDTTLEDAMQFCRVSKIPNKIRSGDNIHFAITDESDEYLGTISLKSIDFDNRNAEYAITTRKKVHGQGVATEATALILQKAFEVYKLHSVYLNVFSDNIAAIRLYEKCGFTFEGEFREHLIRGEKYMNLKWYSMLENEYRNIYLGGNLSKINNMSYRPERMVA